MNYPRVILSGTNSRVGKTTLTMGIALALKKRGLMVQPFKAGPDYIDPTYHTLVSKKICRNLDTWMFPENAVLELFQRQASAAGLSIIEGVMGLYDGLQNKEEGSTAHLAKILKSPVILAVDASSMSRSAGAVVLGYRKFDSDVDLSGVILNNIGSPSHYSSVKYSIEKNTGLPVLGFLPKDKSLTLPERHLGLIPTDEKALLNTFAKKLLNLVEKNIDINKIIAISQRAEPLPYFQKKVFSQAPSLDKVSIGVAKDSAFNFYYQDNLDILNHCGANIIEFSPLEDKVLPEGIDGLYIGGGFPELFAKGLSKNTKLRDNIYKQAESGLPIYAECGGLMYLVKNLVDFKKKNFPMVGIFDAEVKMGNRLAALGYVNIEVLKNNILSKRGDKLKAHVFHWSHLNGPMKNNKLSYSVKKNTENVALDGLTRWNVLASYCHLHFGSDIRFAKNFIRICFQHKNIRRKA